MTILLLLLVGELFIPAPDSFIYPMRVDTFAEMEFAIFPPKSAQFPLFYKIEWGDGDTLNWTGPVQSPVEIYRYHRYRTTGTFPIRVQAKDVSGNISSWSRPCSVEVVATLVKWFAPTIGAIVAAPALDQNGNIYIGDEEGAFYSFFPNGELRWSFNTKGPIYAGATLDRDLVFVPSLDSQLYCLDTAGNLQWQVKLDDELWSPAAVDSPGNLYLGTISGKLIKISPKGKVLFKLQLGDEIAAAPTVVNDMVFVSADSIYCFTSKGKRRWSFGTPDGTYFFPAPVSDEKGNIFAGSFDGYLYCIGPEGRMRWRVPVPDEDEIRTEVILSPDGEIIFGTDGGYLCTKPPQGAVQVLHEANDAICATPAVNEKGTVYFLSDDGTFYALTKNGRILFAQEIASGEKEIYYSSAPVIAADGTVYVGSWDGGLYAFYGEAPPARTLWSQFRQNPQHTGRLTLKGRR